MNEACHQDTRPAAPSTVAADHALQSLLLEIFARFINLPLDQLDLEVNRSLGQLGHFMRAGRVYIFMYNMKRGVARNTYEWCAPGIPPQIATRQEVSLTAHPEGLENHRRGLPLDIPDVTRLPPGLLRDTLTAEEITGRLALAMMNGKDCIGFVGFDWIGLPRVDGLRSNQMLEIFAQMLGNIISRQRAEEERSHLQAQLAHAVRMESMGRLAGGVAHDFNNMLTVIHCHCRLALDKLSPEDPVRTHLAGIEDAAHRSADITRRLLAFARKQQIMPELIDLNLHVDATLSMLRRLLGENIELLWQPGAHLWPVMVDPGQLDQVLANLCVNARDAIGEREGRIMIETANVTNEYAPEEARDKNAGCSDYIVINVCDNGCGMDAETVERIFEPFFTTKAPGKGTGLGLATVFGIIKQNNGFIEVSSRPGHGTSFMVFLPRYGL